MRVRVEETKDGYVVDTHGIGRPWAPGTYPTKREAARAAWNMRDHGTVDDQPEEGS